MTSCRLHTAVRHHRVRDVRRLAGVRGADPQRHGHGVHRQRYHRLRRHVHSQLAHVRGCIGWALCKWWRLHALALHTCVRARAEAQEANLRFDFCSFLCSTRVWFYPMAGWVVPVCVVSFYACSYSSGIVLTIALGFQMCYKWRAKRTPSSTNLRLDF